MRFYSLPLVVLFAACDDIDISPVPADPDEAPVVLEAGSYELRVDDVKSSTCGFDVRDMVGQHVPAQLEVVRGETALHFGGWTLRGEMAGRSIYVEGGPDGGSVEPGVPPDTDTDVSEPDPGEDDAGGGGEPVDTGADCDGRDCGEDRPDDRPDDRPSYPAFASLDGRIFDRGLADGRLYVEAEGCAMELAVVLTRSSDRPDEPIYAESTDEVLAGS